MYDLICAPTKIVQLRAELLRYLNYLILLDNNKDKIINNTNISWPNCYEYGPRISKSIPVQRETLFLHTYNDMK